MEEKNYPLHKNNIQKHYIYHDEKYIYSIDLMMLYIQKINCQIYQININKIVSNLQKKFVSINNTYISIKNILEHSKKYSEYHKKIISADINSPIILDKNNNVIYGMYILAKSELFKKEYINYYLFGEEQMENFIIGKKNNNWNNSELEYYESLEKKYIEKIFYERFIHIFI